MRRIVCPYCFETFLSTKIAFRCQSTAQGRCPPEPDEALAKYERRLNAELKPKVFISNNSWWRTPNKANCACGEPSHKSVCPHCHNGLPSYFRSKRCYNIALIGAKEAGKSNYIAVLIHELNNRVGYDFDASLGQFDEQTINRYNQDFRRYIYENKEVVPMTLSARAQINVRYPLIYTLSLKRRFRLLKKNRASSLVFFDTAGEDLTHLDIMSTETRYIANSQGLIFLLDPLQIPAVRALVGNSVRLPSENTEPKVIINRVVQLIRQSRGMSDEAIIKTPVALAFSKIDVLRHLFDPSSPVHHASNHAGYFDITEAAQMSDSIRTYLSEWIGTDLDRFVRHNFENFSYFGISSLGSPPTDAGQLPMGVAPFRVEDPLLWLLYELGLIRGRRS